ncbi:MAG: hypothetical protein ACRD1K_20600 [Acidimicrobiales bacterium]
MPELTLPGQKYGASTTQLRALVELARGNQIIMSDRAAKWARVQGRARAGAVRLATALSLARAGWIEPFPGSESAWQISPAGRDAAAGIDADDLGPPGVSKAGLAPVDLLRGLERLHPSPLWILATEVDVGLGERHPIDVLAVSGIEVRAYELKLSRSDFQREVASPRKRARAMEFASSFYFCVPAGLIVPAELPARCGLVEIRADGRPVVVVRGPMKEPERPDWHLVAAILRAAARK